MAESSSHALGGAPLGAWYAPNITSDPNSGVGGWDDRELAAYIKRGDAHWKAQAAGPMLEAVDHSLRRLTDEDVRAIVTYLKSVPALSDPGASRPAFAWGSEAHDLGTVRGVPLPSNSNTMTGPQIYFAYCATCHNDGGQGTRNPGMPSLFHNTALGRANTNNLVMVILQGIERSGTQSGVVMPAFANHLSDNQVSVLTNYLLQRFGNPNAVVTIDQVRLARDGGPSSPLLMIARVGMALVGLVFVALLVFIAFRAHRRTAASSRATVESRNA